MVGSALRGRTVMVTGATGFLGSHLVRALVRDAGAEVHVLVRPGSSARRLAPLGDRIVRWYGDVADHASLRAGLAQARPRTLFHLAGDTAGRSRRGWEAVEQGIAVNLLGTLNLVQAATEASAPVEVMIRLGGLEEYGGGPVPYSENQRERPSSPYSASQVATTHYCQMLQPDLPFALFTLRPALVYGPDQSPGFLIPGLIVACLRGLPFAMTDGGQTRDLLYVDDVVAALLLAATRRDLSGAVLNLSGGREYVVREVAEEVARLVGTPGLLRVGAAPERRGELSRLLGSGTRADEVLGWRPGTSLPEGLRQTVNWYREHRELFEEAKP